MEEKTFYNASVEDLADRVANKLEERLSKKAPDFKKDGYLTRRQLSELLSVDLATLHRWGKSGKLPCYRLGGRIYYKQSDLESVLEKVPNLKDGRA